MKTQSSSNNIASEDSDTLMCPRCKMLSQRAVSPAHSSDSDSSLCIFTPSPKRTPDVVTILSDSSPCFSPNSPSVSPPISQWPPNGAKETLHWSDVQNNELPDLIPHVQCIAKRKRCSSPLNPSTLSYPCSPAVIPDCTNDSAELNIEHINVFGTFLDQADFAPSVTPDQHLEQEESASRPATNIGANSYSSQEYDLLNSLLDAPLQNAVATSQPSSNLLYTSKGSQENVMLSTSVNSSAIRKVSGCIQIQVATEKLLSCHASDRPCHSRPKRPKRSSGLSQSDQPHILDSSNIRTSQSCSSPLADSQSSQYTVTYPNYSPSSPEMVPWDVEALDTSSSQNISLQQTPSSPEYDSPYSPSDAVVSVSAPSSRSSSQKLSADRSLAIPCSASAGHPTALEQTPRNASCTPATTNPDANTGTLRNPEPLARQCCSSCHHSNSADSTNCPCGLLSLIIMQQLAKTLADNRSLRRARRARPMAILDYDDETNCTVSRIVDLSHASGQSLDRNSSLRYTDPSGACQTQSMPADIVRRNEQPETGPPVNGHPVLSPFSGHPVPVFHPCIQSDPANWNGQHSIPRNALLPLPFCNSTHPLLQSHPTDAGFNENHYPVQAYPNTGTTLPEQSWPPVPVAAPLAPPVPNPASFPPYRWPPPVVFQHHQNVNVWGSAPDQRPHY